MCTLIIWLLILPCFRTIRLADHRAGWRWIQLPNKTETACLTKLSQILGKFWKVIKLGKMLLIKVVSNYFSENSLIIFGKFENQQKTSVKWFLTNLWKNFLWRIVSTFCHRINYLLTGLLVPYCEILSPPFLRSDLASSLRTSKPPV